METSMDDLEEVGFIEYRPNDELRITEPIERLLRSRGAIVYWIPDEEESDCTTMCCDNCDDIYDCRAENLCGYVYPRDRVPRW